MALVLSPAEVDAALGKADSELAFAFERNDVSKDVLAAFIHSGIDNMNKFAGIAKDGDDLKAMMLKEFGYDSSVSLGERVRITNIVICFEMAKSRVSERNKLEGELMAKHIIKPLTVSEHGAMRTAWERRFWVIEDEWVPSRVYLERRLEDLEQGEFKAEALTAVLTKDQEDPDLLVPVWSSTGTLQMRKGTSTLAEPNNPEQLRRRIKVLGIGLMMLGLRHSNKQFLQGLSPQTFEDFLTYLLSDQCFYMSGKSAEGYSISGPSWAQLLVYEFQVRRKAWSLVQAGSNFGNALREACKDPCTRERFLVTPLALSTSGSKRSWGDSAVSSGASRDRSGGSKGPGKGTKKNKGSGKGQNKGGSSKGGGKSGGGQCASRTPDGKAICYSYNNFDVRCRDSKCRFLHVCGSCFGKHPIYACRPGNKAETQGEGGDK
jgi:hypothetical protein